MKIPFYVVNAFTDKPFNGNPAGVVLEADDLNRNLMQKIAAELKCSETAFVSTSKNDTFRVQFFSPLKEVDLCGHATIATFYTMAKLGILKESRVSMETNAGILQVEVKGDNIFMQQTKPVFKKAEMSLIDIAAALQVKEDTIGSLPIEAVSTGLFSLNVPITDLDAMQRMKPDFTAVAKICKKSDVGSLFAFTFDTINPDCLIHARCFAPLYGVNEDPVTGTANGALGAYLKRQGLLASSVYISEQGYEVGRAGVISVDVSEDAIKIGGTAFIAVQGEIIA